MTSIEAFADVPSAPDLDTPTISSDWAAYLTENARPDIASLAKILVSDPLLRIETEIAMLRTTLRLATHAAFDPDRLHHALIDVAYKIVMTQDHDAPTS